MTITLNEHIYVQYKFVLIYDICLYPFDNCILQSCTLLKEKIAKVGGTLSDVGKAVRDIAVKVGDKVSDAYKIVVEYTKSKLCKYLKLSCPSSISAENSVTKRSATINDFLKKYKDSTFFDFIKIHLLLY